MIDPSLFFALMGRNYFSGSNTHTHTPPSCISDNPTTSALPLSSWQPSGPKPVSARISYHKRKYAAKRIFRYSKVEGFQLQKNMFYLINYTLRILAEATSCLKNA